MNSLQFQVSQLRAKNTTKSVEGILVLLTALFVTALLPSLLVRYVYAGQQLFEQPKALEYIPVAAFVIGVGYFLLVILGNMLREMKARKLERDLELLGDDCGCQNCKDCEGCNCGACDTDDVWADLDEELELDEAPAKATKAKRTSKKK